MGDAIDTLEIIMAQFNDTMHWKLDPDLIMSPATLQLVIDHCCARGRSDLADRFVKCGRESGFKVGMPN